MIMDVHSRPTAAPSTLPLPSLPLARSLVNISLEKVATMSAYDLFCAQLFAGTSLEANLDAMVRVQVVAATMGPAAATSTLLPFLSSIIMNPDASDELLLVVGQQLFRVAQFCGRDHYADFLPLLERLATTEETVVRDQAAAVMRELCHDLGFSNNTKDTAPYMGVAKRLAGADWFTAKMSACGVFSAVLHVVNRNAPADVTQHVAELLAMYKELCEDETPMVRRAAAKGLGYVILEAGWNNREFCAAVLPPLIHDEQDSVRRLAVAALAHVGGAYAAHPEWTCQHWLPLLKDGSTDMSWRVRHNLSKHFSQVATNLGIGNGSGDDNTATTYQAEQSLVMACFVSVLSDAEPEVRAAAVAHMARMIAWGGPAQFTLHVQPLLAALADDPVMEVRSKCALAIMDTAHEATLPEEIVLAAFGPLFEAFLQDEFHEVQLQVLTSLHKIAHLLPSLAGVVTSLLNMTKATNWRVREAVAKLLPHLAEARGLEFFATVLLEPVWLTLLLDPVASVRHAVVHGSQLLVKVAGDEWVLSNLFPHHVRIYNANNVSYLMRITILQAHIDMACQATSGQLFHDVVTQILRGLADKVANVRMVAAHGLGKIILAEGDAAVVTVQIRPALEKRVGEEVDYDCRQACVKALEMNH